ncbi:MAG TPA: periplasmic heavy metal sensor [Burkholderiales bacterium]|nr:periplasmic heavy metal sensor [Burkholderiales bacterium]
MKHVLTMAALLCVACANAAEHSGPHAHGAPYAGMEKREIKALSDQQVADLHAGRGMALALPAELNGYPGPSHVLELSRQLALTPDQQKRTKEMFETMQRNAVGLGQRVIDRERELDALFAQKNATGDSVMAAAAAAARAQGELRALHLRYHVAMHELLTPEQLVRYNQLRGYASK